MERPSARLYLLFTPRLCAAEPWRTLERAIAGGVDLVQWRVAGGEHGDAARALELCRALGVPLVINDDAELARRLDADGVHVGQSDTAPARARAIVGSERWVGVSTHDAGQVRAAEAAGADYLGFGPCFPTATKGYREGLAHKVVLPRALAAAHRPVFAIGGIDTGNLDALVARGVRRIAVCGAILRAADPAAAAAALRAGLPA